MKAIVNSELENYYGGANRGDRLNPGQSMYAGDFLISRSGMFYAKYESSGNFALYDWNNRPIWTSPRWRSNISPGKVTMQASDGNFVVYNRSNQPVFSSNKYGPSHVGSYLILQNDGNLVTYNRYNRPTWASGTNRSVPSNALTSSKYNQAVGASVSAGGLCGVAAAGASACAGVASFYSACGVVTAAGAVCGVVGGVANVCAGDVAAASVCGAVAGIGAVCGAVASVVGVCAGDIAGAEANAASACAGNISGTDVCAADANFGVQGAGVCAAQVGFCGAVACVALPIGGNW
ncbi:MAG: hypothetical protein P1U56_06480 [Saprospiraceae bacterium]|nr:hypothetical protein [Saprospiraceae bacterium]